MSSGLPGFGSDPEQAERALGQWAQDLERKAQRASELRAEIDTISVTASSAHDEVSITVDSDGVPTDVRFSDRARRMSGSELSAEFMSVLRRARSRITEQVAEAANSTVGDNDPTSRDAVIDHYRQRFPGPADTETPVAGDPWERTDHDDGDLGDESFLR